MPNHEIKDLILWRCLKIITDISLISLAWVGSFWIRFNLGIIPTDFLWSCLYGLSLILPLQYMCNIYFGVSRSIWRYTSIIDLINIIISVSVGTAIIIAAIASGYLFNINAFPRSVFVLYPILLISMFGIVRITYRLLFQNNFYSNKDLERVIIIGAGQAAADLATDISRLKNHKLLGFLDDDMSKRRRRIHGYPVLGDISSIAEMKAKHSVNRFLISIPSVTSEKMREIVSKCQSAKVVFSTLPRLSDIVDGRIEVDLLRNVSIEDILGREQVEFDLTMFKQFFPKYRVLITGAGGSIGTELSRQVASFNPASLILIDNSEYNLYKIKESMQKFYPCLNVEYYLADVKDSAYIKNIFSLAKPDMVFHAAAYKHVSILENEKYVAIKNNVEGTLNVAQASLEYSVKKFVFISTDKAINPLNTMGKSKRLGELLCKYFNTLNETSFMAVRFGNVMGSVGSVIPKFKEQIKYGGPVTVTDPNVKRFFMTIPEASKLIIYSLISAGEGGTFVLDMGTPISIKYLAEQMIQLSGKTPGVDIDINYTGLQSGEKMEESLHNANEMLLETSHPKISQVNYTNHEYEIKIIKKLVALLEKGVYLHSDFDEILNLSVNESKVLEAEDNL